MYRIVHFEIHAEDPKRAAKFYADAFGWEVQEWPIPGGEPYMGVITGKDGAGINGGIIKRKGTSPQAGGPINAFVCTLDVPNVDDAVKKALAAGGKMALDKMTIPGVGYLAYCIDTEGNIFGLHEDNKEAK